MPLIPAPQPADPSHHGEVPAIIGVILLLRRVGRVVAAAVAVPIARPVAAVVAVRITDIIAVAPVVLAAVAIEPIIRGAPPVIVLLPQAVVPIEPAPPIQPAPPLGITVVTRRLQPADMLRQLGLTALV